MNHSISELCQSRAAPVTERLVTAAMLIGCIILLTAKVFLLFRININWDEFYFLSEVMAAHRHELSNPLQTQYVHLFGWLSHVNGDEIERIFAARIAMACLLALTCVALWYLACRWVCRTSAIIAPIAYLSTLPVMLHGASFRSDSILVLLGTVAACVLSRGTTLGRVITAGVLLGFAGTITIKAAFLIPVLAGLILFDSAADAGRAAAPWRRIRSFVGLGLVSASVFLVLLAIHAQSLGLDPDLAKATASNAFATTLLESEPLPGSRYLTQLWFENRPYWLLLIAGAVVASLRRNLSALCCALSLLPLLIYRNAFPYYFVVMLATASVLAAFAVDAAVRVVVNRYGRAGHLLPLLLAAPLFMQAQRTYQTLQQDTLSRQRELIGAVHRIFPQPVNYIDHSGMIASFPKANFFMTRWGVEDYLARGQPFMPIALAQHRPPLLLANRPILDPDKSAFQQLLPADRELIQRHYIRYWGPVFVAGARMRVTDQNEHVLRLPFSGNYRLTTHRDISVNGVRKKNGDILQIGNDGTELVISVAERPIQVPVLELTLTWAGAAAPPPESPPTRAPYVLF